MLTWLWRPLDMTDNGSVFSYTKKEVMIMHRTGLGNAIFLSALCLAVVVSAVPALAHELSDIGSAEKATLEKMHPSKPAYSPYAGRNFPTRPFFGDSHLHTSFSMDAGAFGARLTPRDAYRFARGEEITSNTGQPVKLSRPLDFLVVADHSDGFGFFPLLMNGDPTLLAQPQGRKWYDRSREARVPRPRSISS